MKLFDTHAHLNDEQLLPQLDSILESAAEAGLVGMTAIGIDLATSEACYQLACQHSPIVAAVGIHPNECHKADQEHWATIRQLAETDQVVAIGETGLDRYWDFCPIETQRVWFQKHIELSFALAKPLVIHMRDCEQDILAMLKQHQQAGHIHGIMHSFTGTRETAKQCLDWGMYISFAGMVTFKKSDELRKVAATIPLDRILIETDSPYLSPHPHRGKRPNHPAMVQHTAACLAQVFDMPVEAFAAATTSNAQRVFGINPC